MFVLVPPIGDDEIPDWLRTAQSVMVLPTPALHTATETAETDSSVATNSVAVNRQPAQQQAQWLAHVAALLMTATAAHPGTDDIVLVCAGSTCALAPRLGFACRSARRPVHGYVLIDGPLPSADTRSDWPDAPVTVVCENDSDVARQAELRGWLVVPPPMEPNACVDFAHWDAIR